MNIANNLLKKNDCYKQKKKIKPVGIVVHSTGCNNVNVIRYTNVLNGWNKSGVSKCVHGFIGMWNGKVEFVQTLPFDYRCWGCGSGTKGSYNNGYIQFEICEDDLTSKEYFDSVYNKAIEVCVYLCKRYNIKANKIVCHSEAYKLGYASNHADVMHWFPKFGKSMVTFRNDVQAALDRNPWKEPTRTIYYRKYLLLKGDDVKWVQHELGIKEDGKCGPATDKAIRAFQENHGLKVDGKCGPATRKKMKKV